MGNSFGKHFRITTFGESHGAGIGVVIDGCPAGLSITIDEIQGELNRRRPGQSAITTPRNEKDAVIIQSGIYKNQTLGTPISLFIANTDQISEDYSEMVDLYRPSHADYSYIKRYGLRDHRGGGRSSNRESAARVAAAAIAKKLIAEVAGISTLAWVSQISHIVADIDLSAVTPADVEAGITRCPDRAAAALMVKAIEKAQAEGDSLGGIVQFRVLNCPAGLGSPVFDKLTSDLARALISINATRSFDIGLGRAAVNMQGSTHNDQMQSSKSGPVFLSNNSGGIQGGISNGEMIYGEVSFKPVATIKKEQQTIDSQGKSAILMAKGRHDPCVLPRAVPIVEAMVNLVLADQLLEFSTTTIARLKAAIKS